MYPRDIRVNSPLEALIVEQALAMVREMKRAADAAPDGKVLDQAETIAVSQGRELTRRSLEAVLNDQAQEIEKKGRRADVVRVEQGARTAGGTRVRSSQRQAR